MTESLSHWTHLVAVRGARVVGVLILAFLLVRLLRALTRRLVHFAKSQSRVALMRQEQTETLARALYTVGTAIIAVGAFLMILPEFGFDVTPVEVTAGLASVAIGFAAQNLLRDLINGFLIVFEDQFVIGDIITVGNYTGRVELLSLRRTVLRNERGAIVTLPNGTINQVANLSRDWSQTFVDVAIPPGQELGPAIGALERISSAFRIAPEWSAALTDGPRVLGVEAQSLSGTVLRLQLRTLPTRQDDVARELRRRILQEFEESKIPLCSTERVALVGESDLPPSRGT